MATAIRPAPAPFLADAAGPRLTRKERELLAFLKQNAGRCLSRRTLMREVWGYQEGVKSRTLDVHIQRLRKKLGPEKGRRIVTVFRGGYLWISNNGDLGLGSPD